MAHYSTPAAYPRDYRLPDREPIRIEMDGHVVYGDPRLPDAEDTLRA